MVSKVGKDGVHMDPVERWTELASAGWVPVLLVRHGRTILNATRRMAGRTDVPLDDLGRHQAHALRDRLADVPRAALYCSPLARAVETAEALGTPTVVVGLQEIDHGELEGHPSSALVDDHPDLLARWVADPTHVRLPGGETLGECRDRAWSVLGDLVRRHEPGPPIVVVSHQMVLGALLLEAQGLPLSRQHEVRQKNTALSLLGFRDDDWKLVFQGDVGHLRPG